MSRGLVQASGGNLSVRLPGTDRFLVTGSGTWLDRLEARTTSPSSPSTASTWAAPTALRRVAAAPANVCGAPRRHGVVHLHPQHVLLVDMLGAPIRFTTLDHQYYLGSAGRVPFLPSGSREVADAAAEAARDHDAVVLAHHGCSTFGETMSMALRRASTSRRPRR